ncbi:50S ribosomal protein L11 [Candidatus Woesearchaeota archaeon]|nr:50S ribosomal protein L11 [Candidatus Woesearchaeota archaeon]
MPVQIVDALVQGGKASAGPPLGPTLGQLKVNIGQVISEINNATKDFNGMQVPVKIHVNTDDKSFEISVGTPPVSALVKKEAGIDKGSGNPLTDKVADIRIEQVIKVAKMKSESLLGKDMFAKVKEVIGTCNSMGVLVEGKQASEVVQDINKGAFKEKIFTGKTELSAEDLKQLEAEKKRLQEEVVKKREQFMSTAKKIIEELTGKPRSQIKAKLVEAGIPTAIIDELLPAEAVGSAAGAVPPKK